MEVPDMSNRAQIERQIREVVANAADAFLLSQQLFTPDGLFNQLASTEEERREVVKSPLFKQSQRRFSELQRKQAAEFAEAVKRVQDAVTGIPQLHKLEPAERV
jgi:hypothetical protein